MSIKYTCTIYLKLNTDKNSACRQRAAVYGAVRIRVRMGPQHSLLVGHGELMRRSSGQIKGFVTAGVARQKSVPAQRPIASNKALMQAFTGKDDVSNIFETDVKKQNQPTQPTDSIIKGIVCYDKYQ